MIPLFEIIVIISFASIVQSIFGVGVLLIGTPLLLSLGYPFFEAISFLLPTSLAISLIQVYEYSNYLNYKFVKIFLIFTLPLVPVGLFFANRIETHLGIIVGIFLLISLTRKGSVSIFYSGTNLIRRYFGFCLLGFIHGLTNLGGAILPSYINNSCRLKDEKLATTSLSYALFVSIQIPYILFFYKGTLNLNYDKLSLFVLIGIISNRVVGKWLYKLISNERYSKYLQLFIILIALYLIIKPILFS